MAMRGMVLLAMSGVASAIPTLGRQLQSALPDKCSDPESFQAWTALVNSACCTNAASACTDGLPTSCDTECANVLTPYKRYCKTQLQDANIMQAVNAASNSCPHIPKNTRGCTKDIPSVSDANAVQSCAGGEGFWPVGTVCSVTCAAGGGHRRAQAGAAMYMCTSGGDWLSPAPIHCASGPPPPPARSTVGRFSVSTQPMTITDAVTYCRNQGGSLASIHSPEEQDQAVEVCSSVRTDATTGATINGDQATHGGYGCWIGFEDSASDGGFVWTDGSNVDYVNFFPGEPNGNRCTTAGHQGNYCSAVSIDMRGFMGDLGMDLDPSVGARGRNGAWNDDSRNSGSMLYPICQSTIPQSEMSPTARHMWGNGASTSFNIRVCVEADDYLFFQDDRLWMQYGGNSAAPGTARGDATAGGTACGDEYVGTAFVNEQPWDISGLGACHAGSTCPVSTTFTDMGFEMPMGCASVQVSAVLNSAQGSFEVTQPSRANGWRGEILMRNPYDGEVVMDATVTAACQGTAATHQARLSCVHNAGTDSCNMGRIEVFNNHITRPGAPSAGAWGTVCGHYFWDNDELANIVCRQQGYTSGQLYTFGATNFLPTLPIVAGWRLCHGGERDIFACEAKDVTTAGARTQVQDPICANGCKGPDGLQGTADDTIDETCTHAIDQGAICYADSSPSQLAVPVCRGCGSGGCALAGNTDQDVIFSCIDYYTTQCQYDATSSALNIYEGTHGNVWEGGEGSGAGTYMWAMRQFARCAAVSPEPQGYCHGAITSADKLANHDICTNGATTNIGFHIRVPFKVNTPGDFQFRLHADYGTGSFIGVDGSEYTPGSLWGHINVDGTSLTAGDHEFGILGFEDCCDGHAELEVHLPCDADSSPWRTVVHGASECLTCGGAELAPECSMDTVSAACCGQSGLHIQCGTPADGTVCGDGQWADPLGQVNPDDIVGRFVAISESMNIQDAITYCNTHFAGIASIHSPAEQTHAQAACTKYADGSQTPDEETGAVAPYGCWIGFTDEAAEGGFAWVDGTPVDYVAWAPGEPNSYSGNVENAVEMDFRDSISRSGYWNDAPNAPDYGMFPLCQTQAPLPPAPGSPPAPMLWGTGQTSSFQLEVCIDHVDTLFFQDDRLWFQYNGQWSAAGAHGSCPDRFRGQAYVNNQPWDISDMAHCHSGVECPVSKTFTDRQFEVPMGCANIDMQVTVNSGRGTQPQTIAPSQGNSFRGEVILNDDGFSGADVYDITVTLNCQGTAPNQYARLSCTHATGTEACHMGRMEVFNPSASHGDHETTGVGAWGTVCGHYTWDNNNAADIICRQLGFASGEGYTFGSTNLLPTLPVVAGFMACAGTESDTFHCPRGDSRPGRPADPYCAIGCLGPDGIYGTLDDTIDSTCTHAIDQGAICMRADSMQQMNPAVPTCRAVGGAGVGDSGNSQQPVVFGCFEYYTTNCVYDVTHAGVTAGHGSVGSYVDAMRAFATCAAAVPEVAGYCHGALQDGSMLSNHMVCMSGVADDPATADVDESQGATTDIGFHIRIPFRVNDDGLYTFRYHMDMGLGSFMGIDGPEWRPGNTWGHLETDGTVLSLGEHEWEVLGFEDCCDGHAELEVHIPCDTLASPWRTITAGVSPCMSCDAAVESSCSMDTTPAAICRTETTGCDAWQQPCTPVSEMVCSAVGDPTALPTGAHVGRFVAVGRTMSYNDAVDYCEQHYRALASIHSYDEQQQAASACHAYADATESATNNADGSDGNAKYGCWIGFQDLGSEGGFVWFDGSSVSFVDFAPGEPNGVNDAGDEDAVEIDFRQRLTRFGEWNDATMDQAYEMFPLCETSIPAPVPGEPMNWGTDVQASFRVRLCVDEADDVHFQDDRLWIEYGGQYSAAGTHSSCPDRYRGKAYVGNQIWDISSLGACQPGQNCAVSSTFTDPQFEVPMGCQQINTQIIKTRGRGTVTSVTPAAGNAWRGTITIEDDTPGQHGADGFAGADVYDIRVTLTCVGGERSAPQTPVRLSCTHNHGTDSCHMGRIEVFNPQAMHENSPQRGAWGSVCGHFFWDNNNVGDIVCRQLGYASGDTYTFGHTNQLPSVPVVIAGGLCDGSEASLFGCPVAWTSQEDPRCINGCLGADGLQGTSDDTVDPQCVHTVDLGAICHNSDSPSNVALPICQGSGSQSMLTSRDATQPVVFGCVDYYTTACTYDITNTNLANNLGSFSDAMRAFAVCADAAIETPGYCHGSLQSAASLGNQVVCTGGVTTNIGYHVRIPFRVHMPGSYSFRMHADYGLGSYIGVDGAEFTPGNIYNHIQTAPQSLSIGEHEFESLGFEDCCDGFAQLEVHLPCDAMASPWRIVNQGASDCLQCGAVLSAACSGVDDGNPSIGTGGADGTGR